AEVAPPPPPPVPRRRPASEAAPVAPPADDDWIPAGWLRDDAPAAPADMDADLAAALRGVHRIESRRIELEAPKPRPLPIQHERDEAAALAESIYAPTTLELHLEGGEELFHLAQGVPRSVLRDLRRGRWVVQEQVDLHGCNRDEARDLLAACMGRWKKEGMRCVRVVHGKGRGSPGREPVLKKLVAGWLRNYADVMAYCQARLPDGGAGALIVLLKATRPPRQG
ncbi:MAG: Smr/MutS family protein, partial [Candidatus Dactylopiibacterium sp.]|nr:Smr/MutS family protein [Candidatus Dactylopiibacterium sp.]